MLKQVRGKCEKCGSKVMMSDAEENRCFVCGFINYVISAEVQQEYDRSVGKKKLVLGRYDRKD